MVKKLVNCNGSWPFVLLFLQNFLFFSPLSLKTLHSAFCIDYFLLPCIKGMASRADIDVDLLARRDGLDYITACTNDLNFMIFGMNS